MLQEKTAEEAGRRLMLLEVSSYAVATVHTYRHKAVSRLWPDIKSSLSEYVIGKLSCSWTMDFRFTPHETGVHSLLYTSFPQSKGELCFRLVF